MKIGQKNCVQRRTDCAKYNEMTYIFGMLKNMFPAKRGTNSIDCFFTGKIRV